MMKKWKIMLKHDFCEKLRIFSEELKTLGEFAGTGFVWSLLSDDQGQSLSETESVHSISPF